MSRKRKKGKNRESTIPKATKKDGAFSFLGNRNTVAVLLVVSVLLSTMGGWWYFNYGRGSDDGYRQFIDRAVSFPKDEGRHAEPLEAWTIVLHLNNNMGEPISIHTTYAFMEEEATKAVSITDPSALTGENYHSYSLSDGALFASSDTLNISWNRGQESDALYAMKSLTKDDPKSVYSFSMEYHEEAKEILAIDCMIYNDKIPVLYGSDGMMFFYELGTLYGYFLPRMSVRGNATLGDGTVLQVEGIGWMEHTWGYFTFPGYESMHIQLRNGVDIRLMRLYSPFEHSTPGLEYYYYIRNDGSFDITQWQPDMVASLSVRTDGSYETIDTVQYHFYPTEYFKAPWGGDAAYGSGWRFISGPHGIDILIDAAFDNQFSVFYQWAGTATPRDNHGTVGRAYAIMNHAYSSNPTIKEVRDNRARLELPIDPTEVRANITNGVPYEHIHLVYRVDGGDENRVGMSPVEMEANVWKGTIPGQPTLFTVVEYRIEVLDKAGTKAETDWESYTVRVE